MPKHTFTAGFFCAFLSTGLLYAYNISLVRSDGEFRDSDVQLILPDENFVRTECRKLTIDASRYLPDAIGQVNSICAAVRQKKITPDKWIIRIDPVARRIDGSIPCKTCKRIFLAKREPVPNGFSTYVLALLPSKRLLSPDWAREFRKQFDSFGESIGNKKLAVWLGTRYGDYIDGERNKYYCDRFNFNYNDGPYLVVTKVRPDRYKNGEELIFIKLGGISKDRVLRVLNILEQDLRTEHDIRKRVLIFEEVKQRLFSAAERNSKELKDVVVSLLKK